MFSGNLMLSFIDKVTAEISSLVLVINLLLLCFHHLLTIHNIFPIENQVLLSQLINKKLRDLQKLLRYLSGTVTSMFKGGIDDYCAHGG